jgi:hypothetical protein
MRSCGLHNFPRRDNKITLRALSRFKYWTTFRE